MTTIHTADAFALLPTMADGSVDVTITDPPFDERTHAGARSQGETESKIRFPPLAPGQLAALVAECLRVSRRWVIAFCSLEDLGAYRDAAGEAWVRAGIWDKPDPTPQISGDRPAQGAEGIAIMHRPGPKRWNGGGHRAVWTCGVERVDRVHPTQKPVKLMRDLIELFSEPGETVLDPFCGSGSTGVACVQTGRRFVGIEKDPAMAQVAIERVAAAQRGQTLAQFRAGQEVLPW